MKDTNVLMSALIKDSVTREVLLLPFFDFLLPEFALDEINRYKGTVCSLSGLDEYEVDLLLSIILERVTIIPSDIIKPHFKEADAIIGKIDPGDIPFVALGLAVDNHGIWSNDAHFDKIVGIKVWKTTDIVKYLRKI